jgi:hypothetical protein
MGGPDLIVIIIAIVIAALAGSALTGAVLLLAARRMLAAELERRLETAGAELEARVAAGVHAAAREVLPELRREVGGGVRDGADQVVPQLRREVGEGVREALLGKAGERLARTGSSVLGAGLDLILGRDDDGTSGR